MGQKKLVYSFLLFVMGWIQTGEASISGILFYGTTQPVKVREKVLNEHLGDGAVLVLGKQKDFAQALEENNYSVVVAPSFFIQEHSDYEPVLQFLRNGKSQFFYKIITLSDKKAPSFNLDVSTVGVIEEMNRSDVRNFIKNNVGLNILKTNTVSKAEDLFPLLVFGAADCILVSEENYFELSKVFNAKTNEIHSKINPIKFPQVFLKKGKQSDLIKKFETLPNAALNELGFDGIERITK